MENVNGKTVLVIDDEREVCDLLRLILESRGYRCLVAHDGEKGLARLKESIPDAVILDIMMPGVNGYELAIRLKGDPATAGIPLMVLTALTTGDARSDEEWRHLTGVDAFMTKPLKHDEFLAQLERLIAARR